MNIFEKEVAELNKLNEKIADKIHNLKNVRCEVWVLVAMVIAVVAANFI